ncbi:MAG TPA: DUF1361 domain-containing protein [Clostridia bacterium]|nr:DUF1361 domain-containing protein [Clostridia bacterium]
MGLLKLVLRRETVVPMLALAFASLVSVMLVIARILWTGRSSYEFLIWNLFLAWLPLVFAVLACSTYQTRSGRNWRFLGFAGAWLLFFPNAPYIFTDLIHLTGHYRPHFWVDLVLILLCAFTGLVIGFVSLFLMQSVVRRWFGTTAGWFFIALVAALSGVGIYIGRFLRFNSWDIIWKPIALWEGIGKWASNPMANPNAAAFPVLFGMFLFIAYLLLYALTHLQHLQMAAVEQDGKTGGVFEPKP